MLPRLQAEERLNAIADGQVSFGTMERRNQEAVLAALHRDAGVAKAKPKKANEQVLASMGISVRTPASKAAEKAPSDG